MFSYAAQLRCLDRAEYARHFSRTGAELFCRRTANACPFEAQTMRTHIIEWLALTILVGCGSKAAALNSADGGATDGGDTQLNSCVARSDASVDPPTLTSAALPSGVCNPTTDFDCQLLIEDPCNCPPYKGRIDQTRCDCRDGSWRCYVIGPGGSYCPSQSECGSRLDAGGSGGG